MDSSPGSESLFGNVPHFQAHQPTPPSSSPPASESLFCNVPHFQAHQPIPPSSSPPGSESSFAMCHVSELTNLLLPLPPLQLASPYLQCAMCHISKLTSPLLSLPPLQQVSSHLLGAAFPNSPTHTFLF